MSFPSLDADRKGKQRWWAQAHDSCRKTDSRAGTNIALWSLDSKKRPAGFFLKTALLAAAGGAWVCLLPLFLLSVVGVVSLVTGAWLLQRVFLPRRVGPSEIETLAALLDTVIPDGEFPGARRTGVLNRLVPECEATRQRRRALVEGVQLLDRKARQRGARSFLALEEAERAAIFAECARAAEGTLPRFFYRIVRDRAMELHYAQPGASQPLGLPHPPQPDGHLDYWRRPLQLR